MRSTHCLLAVMVAAYTAPAFAGIYRCEQDGRLSFSDRPCAAGQEPIALARPNTLETSPGQAKLAQRFDDRTASLRDARLEADVRPAAARGISRRLSKPSRARGSRRSPAKAPKVARPARQAAPAPAADAAQQGLKR